jgi:hypothetical protein
MRGFTQICRVQSTERSADVGAEVEDAKGAAALARRVVVGGEALRAGSDLWRRKALWRCGIMA